MFARKLLLLGLGILSPLLSACDETECGDGTVEMDGVCVAADTDESGSSGSPGFTASNSGPDDDDNGGSGGGDGEPYQACPAESDVQCVPNSQEFCIELSHTCSESCFGDDTLCPAPSGGTAVQRCEEIEVDPGLGSNACVLFCGGGLVCPDGMSCEATPLLPSDSSDTLEICVWN